MALVRDQFASEALNETRVAFLSFVWCRCATF